MPYLLHVRLLYDAAGEAVLAKIAVELERALRRRELNGTPGHAAPRIVARGDGWTVADVVCTSGPEDRPFEEQHAPLRDRGRGRGNVSIPFAARRRRDDTGRTDARQSRPVLRMRPRPRAWRPLRGVLVRARLVRAPRRRHGRTRRDRRFPGAAASALFVRGRRSSRARRAARLDRRMWRGRNSGSGWPLSPWARARAPAATIGGCRPTRLRA